MINYIFMCYILVLLKSTIRSSMIPFLLLFCDGYFHKETRGNTTSLVRERMQKVYNAKMVGRGAEGCYEECVEGCYEACGEGDVTRRTGRGMLRGVRREMLRGVRGMAQWKSYAVMMNYSL